VTGKGFKHLVPLMKLTNLDRRHTKVTDAGLKELAPLKGLTELDLRNTQVTDADSKNSVWSRASLPVARRQECDETRVSRLQKMLPKCNIRVQARILERRETASQFPMRTGM